MGLFDYVRCKYRLPDASLQGIEFQSKDTPAQFMERYEIREDGTLWHEVYDTEDRSDPNAPPGSLESILGCMTRVNERWERVTSFTAEICFGALIGEEWVEFSAYFIGGRLRHLEQIAPAAEARARGE